MKTSGKVCTTAIVAGLALGCCLLIESVFRESGGWLAILSLLPLGYLVFTSIIVYIGDLKGLFEYIWIAHAFQFLAYGTIFCWFWVCSSPKRGLTCVAITHVAAILAYVLSAVIWVRSRT